MNILIIDNSAVRRKDKHNYCTKKSGNFGLELSQMGHNIIWFQQCFNLHHEMDYFDLTSHNFKCILAKKYHFKLFTYIFSLVKAIKAIILSDFVYMFYPNSYKFILILCILFKKPYGVYIRGMNGIFSKFSCYLYKNSKVVLTVTPYFTDKIKALAPRTTVDTIRPMVEVNEKDKYEKPIKMRDSFNLLFLARLDKDKGIFELLEAVKILRSRNNYKFKLSIYGFGAIESEIEHYINNNKIRDCVSLMGVIKGKENVLKVFRQSDIYILPTYHEGFPRTLYEAMISGTPIITTLVGGIPYLMKDGFNCISIKEHDVNSIVEKLTFFFENYISLSYQLRENAFNTVIPIISSKRPSHAETLHQLIKI